MRHRYVRGLKYFECQESSLQAPSMLSVHLQMRSASTSQCDLSQSLVPSAFLKSESFWREPRRAGCANQAWSFVSGVASVSAKIRADSVRRTSHGFPRLTYLFRGATLSSRPVTQSPSSGSCSNDKNLSRAILPSSPLVVFVIVGGDAWASVWLPDCQHGGANGKRQLSLPGPSRYRQKRTSHECILLLAEMCA